MNKKITEYVYHDDVLVEQKIIDIDGTSFNRTFHEDADIVEEVKFDSDGNEIFREIKYSEIHTRKFIENFMKESKESSNEEVWVKKEYYKDSCELQKETPYQDGEIHGVMKTYYESGVLKKETPYVKNEKHGLQISYYESGNIESKTQYKKDKLDGYRRDYYLTGKLCKERFYKNGKRVGVHREYREL